MNKFNKIIQKEKIIKYEIDHKGMFIEKIITKISVLETNNSKIYLKYLIYYLSVSLILIYGSFYLQDVINYMNYISNASLNGFLEISYYLLLIILMGNIWLVGSFIKR